MGVDMAHIHDEAERYEHILTSEQVDAVDKQLGYPALDPHGSPIPSKSSFPRVALDHLKSAERGMISQRQPGAEITYRLWDLGLGPGDVFEVTASDTDFVIQVKAGEIKIPADLVTKISVEKIDA
jgi:Fe2+ transport system protein FeoA